MRHRLYALASLSTALLLGACAESTSSEPGGDSTGPVGDVTSLIDATPDDDAPPSGDALPGDDASPLADVTETDAPDVAGDDAEAPLILPALVGTVPAPFKVRAGVEVATVEGAAPGTPVTLYDPAGKRLLTIKADAFGHAHFAYLPAEHQVLDVAGAVPSGLVASGYTLPAGPDYVVRDDSTDPPQATPAFRVLAVDDHPPVSLYEKQDLTGIPFGLLGLAPDVDVNEGFNYIEMRDGVLLSAMVRFPDPALWGEGPYPTVVEYSGYSPSKPGSPSPGSGIATLLGYASVGVNMRGTGCSGGVFDIFSPAQHADGYDVIEVVSRQPWVLHNKVGMVGLSYPGISELYVAYTQPPGLASVTPLSVLADPWILLRPGGIYNQGFTRQWLAERDAEAAPGGQSWTDDRIAGGDTVCAEHQDLRTQNLPFEEVFKALEFYPAQAPARSLPVLVHHITVPVYLTGGFQDEQTGPQFIDMLGDFTSSPLRRFVLYNGRHVDGYSPLVLTRWWEFLELTVAQRVPRMPEWMRTLGAEEFSKSFDSTGLAFEADRFPGFADDDYAGVLAAYKQEPEVRVLFENGGVAANPGAPIGRYEASFSEWPPASAVKQALYLAPEGTLMAAAPATQEVDAYTHDPDAGARTFFGPEGYKVSKRMWDIDWSQFPEGKSLAYETPVLDAPMVLGGPGYAELWVSSDAADVNVQVTLSEVRTDGQELLVTSGWHRLGHTQLHPEADQGRGLPYTYAEADFSLLEPGERRHTQIPLPSVAHTFRAGSRLRMVIATPGRNHGTWEFTNPTYDGETPTHRVYLGGDTPSALHLSLIQVAGIPEDLPVCPGLRGQPCRPYVHSVNTVEAPTPD